MESQKSIEKFLKKVALTPLELEKITRLPRISTSPLSTNNPPEFGTLALFLYRFPLLLL